MSLFIYALLAVAGIFTVTVGGIKGMAVIGKWLVQTATWLDENSLSITSKLLGKITPFDNSVIEVLKGRIDALEETLDNLSSDVSELSSDFAEINDTLVNIRGY